MSESEGSQPQPTPEINTTDQTRRIPRWQLADNRLHDFLAGLKGTPSTPRSTEPTSIAQTPTESPAPPPMNRRR